MLMQSYLMTLSSNIFPTVWDEDTVHVWKSKNPINGLVYGFWWLEVIPNTVST